MDSVSWEGAKVCKLNGNLANMTASTSATQRRKKQPARPQPQPQPQPETVSQTPLAFQISSVYGEYQSPVIVYRINTERATSFTSAYDWVEAIPALLKENDLTTTYKTFKHITHGYIKDGDHLSIVVLQNASDPFPSSFYPRTTTSLGVYHNSERTITWTTITPHIPSLLLHCIEVDILKEVGRWDFPPPPAQLRFHKAYWLLANLKSLGGLLNDATRQFGGDIWVEEEDDDKKDGDGNENGEGLEGLEKGEVVPEDMEMIDEDDEETRETWEPTNSGWEATPEQERAAVLQLQHPECRVIGFSE